MTGIAGKTVAITGAASGLGRLMAQECAAKGASLLLWDINDAALASLKAELNDIAEQHASRVMTQTVNLCNRQDIEQAATKALAQLGGVDILINNAGLVTGKPLLESSPLAIEQTFGVNTMALFWTTQAFLPGMIERADGHIVTVASMAGIVGIPNAVDYCASKHAAVGFDESLRLEMKTLGYPIRTTVICPYAISTGMFDGFETRFSWLLPILKPEDVVSKTLRAIEANRARVLMPWMAWTVFMTRYLPIPVFDKVMDFFGITSALNHFKGREGGHAGEIKDSPASKEGETA